MNSKIETTVKRIQRDIAEYNFNIGYYRKELEKKTLSSRARYRYGLLLKNAERELSLLTSELQNV